MTKLLGIDYGLTHIGLAVSEHTLATPLSTMANNQELLTKLAGLISTEGITHIVCGLPEGKLVPIIKDFANQLSLLVHLPVTLHPETLSTQEAKQKLVESGANRAKKRNDHAYAACLILEDYLELYPVIY